MNHCWEKCPRIKSIEWAEGSGGYYNNVKRVEFWSDEELDSEFREAWLGKNREVN